MAHTQPDPNSILLWPAAAPASAPGDSFRPWMDLFLTAATTPRGIVVICPGGGYGGRGEHEGEPIAKAFNAAGLHAAVVQYRVAPNRHPAPLLDVARAVRILRRDAGRLQIDPDRIAVCGFSAGGHLAASIGVHYDLPAAKIDDELSQVSCKPNALVLCYPVISALEYPHQGSFKNLLGEKADVAEWRERMSLEKHVTAQTPPTFLWHTVADAGVAIENTVLFAQALRRHQVVYELHAFPFGRHGLGLALNDPHVNAWVKLCAGFFGAIGWLPQP